MKLYADITPHDNDTYLIQSRSGEGKHIVDTQELTCSCEHFNDPRKHPLQPSCWHLERVLFAIYNQDQ